MIVVTSNWIRKISVVIVLGVVNFFSFLIKCVLQRKFFLKVKIARNHTLADLLLAMVEA